MAISEANTVENTRCKNCGSELSGDFCARCGQQAREVRRPFLLIVQEFIYVLLELDGRAYRTFYYLFTRPGFLSLEYVNGRRAHYTPPLRLFLVICIGFFLIISVQNTVQSTLDAIDESSGSTVSVPEPLPVVPGDAPLPEDVEQIVAETRQAVAELEAELDREFEDDGIEFDLGFDDREELHEFIDTIEFGFFSEEFNQNLRALMHTQAEENFEALNENPEEVFYNSLEYVTIYMLIMMPILALIQKIMFLLSKKYYVEHLILTVHNHAFVFFTFFLMMVSGWIESADVPYLSSAFGWIGGLLWLWIIIYLFLSLKRFFGTGGFVTFLLFFATSFIYMVVSSTGLFFFAAALFLLA